MTTTIGNRLDPIDVLRDLTNASESFLIWKNVERTLKEVGDIDCAAPERDWSMLRARLDALAHNAGLPSFVSCSHLPGVLLNVTIDSTSRRLFEVDLCDRQSFRGLTLFTALDLTELTIDDARGFRRLRPGAEAVYLVLLKGISRWGSLRPDAVDALTFLAEADLHGAEIAAGRLGRVGQAALTLLRGDRSEWRRSDGFTTQASAATWLLTHPAAIADRVRMRRWVMAPCLVIAAALSGREVNDPTRWLERAALEHDGQLWPRAV